MAAGVDSLAARVSGRPPLPAEGTGTRRRILQAALACFVEVGIRRTTVEDVARRAGLGRATLYRFFSDKNALVQAVVLRECMQAMRDIGRRLAGIEDVETQFVEAMVLTVQGARSHPLVRRLFELEPGWLLPHLTVAGGTGFELACGYATVQWRQWQAIGHFTGVDAEAAGELCVRLAHSLVLTPGSRASMRDEEGLRKYTRDFLLPLLRSTRVCTTPSMPCSPASEDKAT